MTSDAVGYGGSAPRSRVLDLVRRVDLRLVLPAILLVILGIVSLSSTRESVVIAQMRWGFGGMVVALGVLLVPYRRILSLAYPFYAFSILLLLVVLIPGVGVNVNGGLRWLRVGGIGFQPSEVAKVAHILVLARYIRFRRDHRTFKGLAGPFLLTLLPMALILKEPDLGTALMFVPTLFALLWVAGARTKHLAAVVGLGVLSLPMLYFVLAPHQQKRVHGFMDSLLPASVAAEVVEKDKVNDYQLRESLSAIAGGGWTGQGWADGRQNQLARVPEKSTDFIFTVHAEEWGFLGVLALIGLELALLLGLATVAHELKDPSARLLCIGAMVLFGTQAVVNLMMTVGFAPITGLPLPFVSYGGSAMLTCWLLLALAVNARAREPVVFSSGDFD